MLAPAAVSVSSPFRGVRYPYPLALALCGLTALIAAPLRDRLDLANTVMLFLLKEHGLDLDSMSTTFFVARATIVDGPGGLPAWRCGLYAWMTRQSEGIARYFNLPPNQVVELGTQIIL